MPLTPEDEQVIQEGLEAQALLDVPFFRKLLKDLSLDCAVQMLETGATAEGTKAREYLFYKHQGLQAVEADLVSRIGAKDSLLAHLEHETATQPESE